MTEIISYNHRADLVVGASSTEAISFAVEHFIQHAKKAISARGSFHVALSGGSTPKAIFERLTSEMLDWTKVHLYWGDERAVSPTDPESNYRMAMETVFDQLPVPKEQIHRMVAEGEITEEAHEYEKLLRKSLPDGRFDLVMLGMGDDGHTASLFPRTHALTDTGEWVAANYVPQKKCWRMTLTYPCINHARAIAIYVMGESKATMVKRVIMGPEDPIDFPIQKIGTPSHKPLWIMDREAASQLNGF